MKRIALVPDCFDNWCIHNRLGRLQRSIRIPNTALYLVSTKDITDIGDVDLFHFSTVGCLDPVWCAEHTNWGVEIVSERSIKEQRKENNVQALSNAKYCIVKNEDLIDKIKEHISCKPVLIPNAVNHAKFRPKKILVGWCGTKKISNLEYKGVPLIMEAVEMLNEELEGDLEFEFVMDPCQYVEKVEDRVILEQETIAQWYRKLDIFMCASIAEGCSNVSIEALSSGLPLITTRVGTWKQFQGIPGIYFVDRDVESIKTGLLEAVNPILRKRKLIKEKFSWPEILRSYKKVFEEALKK